MKTPLFQRGGFTLLEIMIVLAIIGLIVAIALPSFIKTRETARAKICLENLSQIETAKQAWALETGKSTGDLPTDAEVYVYLKRDPACPAGFKYQPNAIGTIAICLSGIPEHAL